MSLLFIFSSICVWVHLILNGFSRRAAAGQVGGLIPWVILSCSASNLTGDLAVKVTARYINHWRWHTLTNHHNLTQSFRGRPLVGGSQHGSKCAARTRRVSLSLNWNGLESCRICVLMLKLQNVMDTGPHFLVIFDVWRLCNENLSVSVFFRRC